MPQAVATVWCAALFSSATCSSCFSCGNLSVSTENPADPATALTLLLSSMFQRHCIWLIHFRGCGSCICCRNRTRAWFTLSVPSPLPSLGMLLVPWPPSLTANSKWLSFYVAAEPKVGRDYTSHGMLFGGWWDRFYATDHSTEKHALCVASISLTTLDQGSPLMHGFCMYVSPQQGIWLLYLTLALQWCT